MARRPLPPQFKKILSALRPPCRARKHATVRDHERARVHSPHPTPHHHKRLHYRRRSRVSKCALRLTPCVFRADNSSHSSRNPSPHQHPRSMRENLPKAHHMLPSFENPSPLGARALAVRCDRHPRIAGDSSPHRRDRMPDAPQH